MPIPALSDQSFLLSFAVAAVAAATATQLWRILVLNHADLEPGPAATRPALDPIEAAYVAGGQQLAVAVAKAALTSSGLLDSGGRPTRGPSDGEGLGSVPRAIFATSATVGGLGVQRCASEPAVQAALTALAGDLRARGLLLGRRQRRMLTLASAPLLIVDALGLARLVDTSTHGGADPALAVAVSFLALLCAAVVFTVPHGTRLGLDLTRAEPREDDRGIASMSTLRGDQQPVPQ